MLGDSPRVIIYLTSLLYTSEFYLTGLAFLRVVDLEALDVVVLALAVGIDRRHHRLGREFLQHSRVYGIGIVAVGQLEIGEIAGIYAFLYAPRNSSRLIPA